MILKGNEDKNEIEGYPVIKRYKYLGITIDDKMKKIIMLVILIKR